MKEFEDVLGLGVPIQHRVDRRLKRVCLLVKPHVLEVRTPAGWSQDQVGQLLWEQRSWVRKQLESQSAALSSGSLPLRVYFLGRPRSLLLGFEAMRCGEVELGEAQIRVFLPAGLPDEGEVALRILDRYFKAQARSLMYGRLISWAAQMGLQPERVRFKRLSSRWGSCSSRRSINLNYRAIQLPLACIDAILVHELAHLKHLDHSRAFWDLVYRHFPRYAECQAEIRALERDLL